MCKISSFCSFPKMKYLHMHFLIAKHKKKHCYKLSDTVTSWKLTNIIQGWETASTIKLAKTNQWNTYYKLNNRVIRRESLVKQELNTLPEYMSSPRFLIVFCVVFCKSLFGLLTFLLLVIVFVSFDLQILITPLASSKSSYVKDYKKWRTKKR